MFTNVRVSFPNLIEARQTNAQNPAKYYGLDMLFQQDNPAFAQFWAAYQELAVAKWKDQAEAVMGMIGQDRKKRCYGQGEERMSQKTMQVLDGYHGQFYISAKEKEERGRPMIVDADGVPIDKANTMAEVAEARRVYGGCYANVLVSPWLWDNDNGKGVSCNLLAVQFSSDGEPFGENTSIDTSAFGAVAAAPVAAAPVAAAPVAAAPVAAAPVAAAPVAAAPVAAAPVAAAPVAAAPVAAAPGGMPPLPTFIQ